ncbi:unnamed protein product [Rotaria magnacalcarata]|uniref:Uncharacterized protein n=1 Tax=Rotaria magnacalcarata TaxID=392030 RepID=A0A8S3F0R8_9BILA|nr:unnamed protein product [Rotaria magnacalcarata]CAF5189470.1 unnamed protein product [Rotaria magnacalcarata]
MFYLPIILICFNHHLLLHTTSASSLLFTLDNVRYSLSDRVLTIPKLGALRGIYIDYENEYNKKYNLVNVEAFLGVQYGLYHGRFEPSKERFELHPTTKVNKQIHFGPACAQHIWTNHSELARIRTEKFAQDYYPKLLKYIQKQNEQQCLYMNIYQPQIKNLKGKILIDDHLFVLYTNRVLSEISSQSKVEEEEKDECPSYYYYCCFSVLDDDHCL